MSEQPQSPYERPVPPPTGDETVDAALAELTSATQEPVADQVEAYVGAHRSMQDRLADLDG